MSVKPIPDGFRTITPHLIIKQAGDAIAFYEKAFGAKQKMCLPAPDGSIMHAEIMIGDSMLMIAEDMEMMDYVFAPTKLGGTTATVALYVEDADALFKQAVDAGATAIMEPNDAFWGDRYSKVRDPFGHEWEIITHLEDLTPEEIGQRAAAMFAQGGPCE